MCPPAVILAILTALVVTACGSPGRILEQAALSRATLTPSSTDRIDLSYTLSRAARVSLTLALPNGGTSICWSMSRALRPERTSTPSTGRCRCPSTRASAECCRTARTG
jgi:hypothetical protein